MTVFSDIELRQRADDILKAAHAEGEVRIRRENGELFILRAVDGTKSTLDVPGVNTGITRDEILQAIREGRERGA